MSEKVTGREERRGRGGEKRREKRRLERTTMFSMSVDINTGDQKQVHQHIHIGFVNNYECFAVFQFSITVVFLEPIITTVKLTCFVLFMNVHFLSFQRSLKLSTCHPEHSPPVSGFLAQALFHEHTHTHSLNRAHKEEAGVGITSSFVSLSDSVSLSPEEVSVWRMCHGWEDEFAWWTPEFIYLFSIRQHPTTVPFLKLISISCRESTDSSVS